MAKKLEEVPKLSRTNLMNRGISFDLSIYPLFCAGPIDYEDRSVYRLVVVARDLGPDSTPGSVTVTINVLDSNDNAPEIIVDTLSSVAGVAEASEMADVGTFVAHVSISDRDSGINGQFNCTLNDRRFRYDSRLILNQLLTISFIE